MKTSEMSDQELNEAIAVKRGWKKSINHKIESWRTYWYDPKDPEQHDDGDKCSTEVPNYCGKWQYVGELLEEMRGILYHVVQPGDIEQWACSAKGRKSPMEFGCTPTRAIAEAWYEVNK
jgi:hypothetical protein